MVIATGSATTANRRPKWRSPTSVDPSQLEVEFGVQTRSEAPSRLTEGHPVLEAARTAWEWYGVACHVRRSDSVEADIAGAVDVPERRRVEVFFERVTDDVWSALNDWVVSDEWALRAVVPRQDLGRAHEALRERRCELQSYWKGSDGLVRFGSVEIA